MFTLEVCDAVSTIEKLKSSNNPLVEKTVRIFEQIDAAQKDELHHVYGTKMSMFEKRKQFCNQLAFSLKMLELDALNQDALLKAIHVLEVFGLFKSADSLAYFAYSHKQVSPSLVEKYVKSFIRNVSAIHVDELITRFPLEFVQSTRAVKEAIKFYRSVFFIHGLRKMEEILQAHVMLFDLKEHIKSVEKALSEIEVVKEELLPRYSDKLEEQISFYKEDKANGLRLTNALLWLKHCEDFTDINVLEAGSKYVAGENYVSFRLSYFTVNYLRCPNKSKNFILNEVNFNVFKRFHLVEEGKKLHDIYFSQALTASVSSARMEKWYYDSILFDSLNFYPIRKNTLISLEQAINLKLILPYSLDLLQLGSNALLTDDYSGFQQFEAAVDNLPQELNAEIKKLWKGIVSLKQGYHRSILQRFFQWLIVFIAKYRNKNQKNFVAILYSGQVRKPEESHKSLNMLFQKLGSLGAIRFASFWEKQGTNVRTDSLHRFFPGELTLTIPEYLRKPAFIAQYFPGLFASIERQQDRDVSKKKLISFFKLHHLNIEKESDFEQKVAGKEGLLVRDKLNQAKMYYQINRAFDLISQQSRYFFSAIIRSRPDISLSLGAIRDICIVAPQKNSSVFVTHVFPEGIGDQFAIGSHLSMQIYSQLWGQAYEKGRFNYLQCFPDKTKNAAEFLLQYHLIAHGVNICLVPSTYRLIMPVPFGSVDEREVLFQDFQKLDLFKKNEFWPFYGQYVKFVKKLAAKV